MVNANFLETSRQSHLHLRTLVINMTEGEDNIAGGRTCPGLITEVQHFPSSDNPPSDNTTRRSYEYLPKLKRCLAIAKRIDFLPFWSAANKTLAGPSSVVLSVS
jgi:hypothetical protein